jgi:hypothetical protein
MADGKSEISETEIRQHEESVARVKFTDTQIAQQLAQNGLENHLDEVVNNIHDPKFKDMYESKKPMHGWSVEDLIAWIMTLKFLQPHNERIAKAFERECINGIALDQIDDKMWVEVLGLDIVHHVLLRMIIDGWKFHIHKLIPCPNGVPQAVAAGVMADLSSCSFYEANVLDEADKLCVETGAGYIYGQLVLLGYREYRIQGNGWQPVGMNNEKFVLKRR